MRHAIRLMLTTAGENHLSFIETSALDASNVELAFQNILTGTFPASYARPYSSLLTFSVAANLPYGHMQRSTVLFPARPSTAATVPRPRSVPAPTSHLASRPRTLQERAASAVKRFLYYLRQRRRAAVAGFLGWQCLELGTGTGRGPWRTVDYFLEAICIALSTGRVRWATKR